MSHFNTIIFFLYDLYYPAFVLRMDFSATIENHELFRRFVKCLQSLARLGQDDIGFLVTARALYLVTENSSGTCKALCAFPATAFYSFEYTVNKNSAIVNSNHGRTVRNLDSGVTLESAFRIKSKALTSIRWSETKDHFCRITVKGIEASNKGSSDDGITVVRSRHKKELRMKLDIKSESGIAKSYQLPCLVPMGTSRLVRNILKSNVSSGDEDENMVTELAMGVRLLRTIVIETIDPRAEDFILIVRDSTVVFKGITLEIKDESGQVLNRPRSTSIKIPIAKFSRFFGFKGTHIQVPLKPLRVLVGLAAGLFLGNGAMRSELTDSLPQNSGTSTFDLDDEPHQFEIELLSSTSGNKTRIQSKNPQKGVSSDRFQFIFDFASKTRTDPRRESTRIEHNTRVNRSSVPVPATNTPASQHRSVAEDSATNSLRSSNNSFGKLIGRSLTTPRGSENSFFTPNAGDDNNTTKTKEKSTSPRKRGRKDDLEDQAFVAKRTPPPATISSGEPSAASDSIATATNEEEETYFRHARDELPKLTTLNRHQHLYSFETHDAAPGPSIGWGESPAHSGSANNSDNDDNVNENDNKNNYVEEEGDNEEDETPAQLLSTRPVLHDLGNSGIGPTQQSTFAKGIFD